MNAEQTKKIEIIMNNYSFEAQREIFVEECAEAVMACQKFKRKGFSDSAADVFANLNEEVADVCIMAEQMKKYLGETAVNEIIDYKLDRQLNRIRAEE